MPEILLNKKHFGCVDNRSNGTMSNPIVIVVN